MGYLGVMITRNGSNAAQSDLLKSKLESAIKGLMMMGLKLRTIPFKLL